VQAGHSYRLAVALVALFAAGCGRHPAGVPGEPAAPVPLAAVSPLPAPSLEPPLASVAPTGDADTLAQVRIRFAADLIPLERLESPDESAVLAHFALEPALPGRFRFLTPRMIGFEPDRAWPAAARVRVRIGKGLRDVRGRTLAADVAWTFQTPRIALAGLPGKDDATPLALRPTLSVASNVALDPASLAAHARVRVRGDSGPGVALTIPPDTAKPGASPGASPSSSPSPAPNEAFDPSQRDWRYALVPAAELERGKRYDVTIEPGVLPRDGNLASDKTFAGTFVTHDALRFVTVQRSEPGTRFADGDPRLAFTTTLDPASLSALALSPAPPRGATAFAAVDDTVGINAALLAPNTDYTVTIGPELRDTFGQKLGSAQRATFRTGDLAADVWAPSGTSLFPAGRDVRLNVVAVNPPPDVRATFRALGPADVVRYPDPVGEPDRGDLLPAAATWPRFDASGPRNVERTIEVPLRAKLGGPGGGGALAYGVAAHLGAERDFTAAGVVQLTDLGVFAQWFPDGGRVSVNRIADGTPVADAQVEVYPSQADSKTKSTPVACARATTDAGGSARFAGPAFAGCAARDGGEEQAPALVTVVRKDADWTYVRSGESTGAYAGDFYNGWSAGAPQPRGTIFSDRQLYQPGETARMTAAGWFLVGGTLRRGSAPSYTLTLEAPGGKKTELGRAALDAYGLATFPVALPKSAPLGYYTVRASAGNGEQILGDFRVAEFKPPNFKVDLALDREVAQRGGTVAGTATSAYLFGAPLAGASTKFTVTRSPADFTPKGRDAYAFGRKWFWPQEPPDAATDVLETTAAADAQGKSAVSVPVANDLPYPMTYQVDAETTDASNVAVADGKPFTALPSDTLIGLKVDDVGSAGKPLSIDAIATDAAGAARAGSALHLELQLAKYASATQIVEGAEQAVESVSYETVASADATSAAGPVRVALTPPKPGTYRLRANAAGAKDDAGETDVELFVGGEGAPAWYARDPNQLTVKLDRATYKPGDTATVLVQSPFPDADVRVAVVRHGVLWETTQRTHGAAPTVRFTVTPGMLPNAAVQAFAVRRGPPPAAELADKGNALARVGFAPFAVALDGKYVVASARAAAPSLEPGARQTVSVHLADAARKPVQGEVTVIVANDAVLRLTGYRPPDLVKTVYADQPISTRFADNRSALALGTPGKPLEKGWGFGGGLSSGDADPRVRRTFSPLAYFGTVRTDAQGNARASFALPDDLTTWRVLVVGATADGRFGNGETTFRTTKPLVANPVIPQFARPGDRFDGGVAVTNGTGATGTLHVDAALAGPLAFLIDDKPAATTMLDAPLDRITKAYRFAMIATGGGGADGTGASRGGEATATIRVRAAGASDAFEIKVPVRDTDVAEAVVQTGTTDNRTSVGIDVAADTPRDAGGLYVALASSLIPELTAAAQDALRGDERLALSAASRLAVASDLTLLGAPGARERAATELATLRDLRRSDGGFAAYWRADRSDAWDSLSALAALSRASRARIPVEPELLAGAHAYALETLADPTAREKWCKDALCKATLRLHALVALATGNEHPTTFLADIDAQRDQLAFADQVRLARLLASAPAYAPRAATLAKTIEGKLYDTGRGVAVNLPGRYAWFDRPVVAQAEVLRLELARRADGETLDRLTRTLLDLRRNGSFGCACETAAALDALVDLAARAPQADFTGSATLAGRTIARENFDGPHAPQYTATVAMRDLPAGRSTLALVKDGSGTLHYAVTYRYRLAGAAPGRLNGLRVTRVVRPANATTTLATMGLALPAASLELAAAHVYDVELQIVSDHPVERVVIADPLPAGMEAVDTTFATTSKALAAPAASWEIGDQRIRTDRVEAYADHLDAGIYRLHYLARTVTPGTFTWPGAQAHLADRPDEFGRSAASVVVVR
jgi:uncharacterized protein YfaS (alpha-2-macroglobulin family)